MVTAALEQTIVRNPGHPIEGFRDVRLEIETEEPPVCRGLDTLCYNELLTAQGKSRSDNSNGSAPLPTYVRLTAHGLKWHNINETVERRKKAAAAKKR